MAPSRGSQKRCASRLDISADDAGSARLLMSQGRTIDAITLLRESEGLSLTEAKRGRPNHGVVMNFDLSNGVAVSNAHRNPARDVVRVVSGLERRNGGTRPWSPYVVIGHLIHGERTDWIPRARIILADSGSRRFTPYDRFAQFRESEGNHSRISSTSSRR